MHETADEAVEETMRMLNVYADMAENYLAMPVIKGRKTDKEKFAGAEATYTIECMMHDGKALQAGTSHYLGDGFARAFDIQFTGRDNKLQVPYQTSWGVSTRIIGGIIMTHGDDSGLMLPPHVAPVQVVIIPVAAHKPGVTEKAAELTNLLKSAGIRAKSDFTDQSPGWKYSEYEMKGIPLRIEVGPRDIENGQCVAVRRDSREKEVIPFEALASRIPALLEEIQKGMFDRAKKNLVDHTYAAHSLEEAKSIIGEKSGFVKMMWCGDEACEIRVKEEAGMSSRCIPFEQEHLDDHCAICGKPAQQMVYWGIAY
jgi:prolyl-tRNA synthetase